MYARFGLFIAGQWQASVTGATAPVFSPVTEQSLGDCSVASVADTEAAIAAVQAAYVMGDVAPADPALILKRVA